MASKGKPAGPRDHDDHMRHPYHDRQESGDNPAKHASIIERRWLGSPPPSFERYARALQQWRALPGAVVSPATGVTTDAPAPAEAGPVTGRSEGEP